MSSQTKYTKSSSVNISVAQTYTESTIASAIHRLLAQLSRKHDFEYGVGQGGTLSDWKDGDLGANGLTIVINVRGKESIPKKIIKQIKPFSLEIHTNLDKKFKSPILKELATEPLIIKDVVKFRVKN